MKIRYPGVGGHDGDPCTCTAKCPAACDGECGCEACERAWIDAGMDELIGTTWRTSREARLGRHCRENGLGNDR